MQLNIEIEYKYEYESQGTRSTTKQALRTTKKITLTTDYPGGSLWDTEGTDL